MNEHNEIQNLRNFQKISLMVSFLVLVIFLVSMIYMSNINIKQKEIGAIRSKAYESPVSNVGGGQAVLNAMPDTFQKSINDIDNLESEYDLPNYDVWTGSSIR